jgi:hypothetical protein
MRQFLTFVIALNDTSSAGLGVSVNEKILLRFFVSVIRIQSCTSCTSAFHFTNYFFGKINNNI